MKKVLLMVMAAAMLVSCGASGEVSKQIIKKYMQPGKEMLDEPGTLRAWAVGVSDSEMTAKKKAMVSATSQLAQMLNSVVTSTVEDYCAELSDETKSVYKEFFSQKCTVVSEQMLAGIRPIFEKCEPADAEGKYRNYVVLEIPREEYMRKLFDVMGQSKEANKIDKQILGDIFLKKINAQK